jgi:hypothetical protein
LNGSFNCSAERTQKSPLIAENTLGGVNGGGLILNCVS